MNELKDKILNYVRVNGPVLPVKISKLIERDVMFASALLAEFVSNKVMYLTRAKIGGSPVYYVKGQEEKLQYLREHLSEKLGKIFDLLKEEKVLRDINLDPWQRVAVREIPDFAKRLDVRIDGNVEVFWKWYLLNDERAKDHIKELLKKGVVRKPVEEKREVIKEKPKVVKKVEDVGFIVNKYFNEKGVSVLGSEIVRKNKEMNYIIEVGSSLGKLRFFVKFLDKKKINEGDLSLAINKAKGKPVLFLSSGVLTKKAQKYLEDIKGSLIFEILK